MRQEFLNTGGEANMDRQSILSAMLLLPPDVTCNLTPEEETRLARQIVERGDRDATKTLYCCCIELVYHYFSVKTRGERSETEYLTQETLVRAVQGLRVGDWVGEAFRPWLFGIARNVFLEWLRGKKKWSTAPDRNGSHPVDEMQQVDPLDEVLIRERGTTLWGLVRELSEQDQLILLLRYVRSLHYAEMAKQLGCTEHACRTRHWRALDHLREKIHQAGPGEELRFGKGKQQHT